MRFLLVLSLVIFSFNSYSSVKKTRQTRNLVMFAMWKLEALDFAIINKAPLQTCSTLGAIHFMLKDLKSRVKGSTFPTGPKIKDKQVVEMILKHLPKTPHLCGGRYANINSEDYEELKKFHLNLKYVLRNIKDRLEEIIYR